MTVYCKNIPIFHSCATWKNLHFHSAHCVKLDLWLNVKVENTFSFNVIFSMHENEISNSVEVFSAF